MRSYMRLIKHLMVKNMHLNISGVAAALKPISPLCLAAQDGGDFVGVPFVLALFDFVPFTAVHCRRLNVLCKLSPMS